MIVDAAREGAKANASPPRSPRCSPSAASAATTSIFDLGWISSAAIARAAREEARAHLARRWAELGGGNQRRRSRSRPPARTAGAGLSGPIARSRAIAAAHFCSPTAAARRSMPATALAREHYLAVAEMTGTAAQARILLAAPISEAEIEQRFAEQIDESVEEAVSIRRAMPCAPRRGTLHAITLSSDPLTVPATRQPRACSRWGSRRSASSGFLARRRCSDGATACSSCARPKAKSGRIFPTQRWRERYARLARAVSARQDLAARNFCGRCFQRAPCTLLPWDLRARLDSEAPTHFDAPTGTQARDRLCGRSRARPSPSACRSCSGSPRIRPSRLEKLPLVL